MNNKSQKNGPIVIALCGKGGVGKTSLSALLTRRLVENKKNKVLAIDADPAIGLSFPLGITVKRTVDDVRKNLIEILKGKKIDRASRIELIKQIDYEIFNALEERSNLAFLAIGRPEGDGCFCQINGFLRDIINETASQFDYVVIDGEAGVEQINRRVMEMVTHLLLVTDASYKGRQVAQTIESIGRKNKSFKHVGLFFNRIKNTEEFKTLKESTKLPVIGSLIENDLIRSYDMDGKDFFDMPYKEHISSLDTALAQFIGQ